MLRWYHQGWSSNSQRLRFGALARWNAVTCDISQDRGIDTASFAANGKLTRETNSWAEFLNIMLQQGKITCRVQRNRLLCQAQQFNPCLQRKVHFIVEWTGRSRKNCYSFSFFPNDLFDNFLQFNFWTNWSLQGNTACIQTVLVEKAENKLHNPVSAQGCFKRLRHT